MYKSKGKMQLVYKELSYEIVGILFEVYNELGYGYQEKFYEKAVAKFLNKKSINYVQQAPFSVYAKGEFIGKYFIDFIINGKIVLELKRGNYFSKRNIEQVKGYLQATKLKLAIQGNFTPQGVKFFRILNPNNKQDN